MEKKELAVLFKKGTTPKAWVPNLMFLSRTGSYLIFVWLIFNFDIFTHLWREFHNRTVSLVASID